MNRSKNLLSQRGVALLKSLFGILILSGMVLVDLKRQNNNMAQIHRKQASESIKKFREELKSWLTRPNTIYYSFGMAPINPRYVTTIYMADDGTANINRIKAPILGASGRENESTLNDSYSINNIFQVDSPFPNVSLTPLLSRQMIESTPGKNVSFIAKPGGQGLNSQNSVYIRAMWIENFQSYNPIRKKTFEKINVRFLDDISKGVADFKVLIWMFTNRKRDPNLDCAVQNNCIRKLLTLPIDIALINKGGALFHTPNLPPDSNYVSDKGKILEGFFGLKCEVVSDPTYGLDPNPCRGKNKIFNITKRTIASDEIDELKGRCCGPAF